MSNVLDREPDGSTTTSDDVHSAWNGPIPYPSPVSLSENGSCKSSDSVDSTAQEVNQNIWDSSTVNPDEITWDNSTADIDEPRHHKEPTYLSNRFRDLHLFYNYLRLSFEGLCHEWAMQKHGNDLADHGWKALKFSNIYDLEDDKDKVSIQYHEPGQAALEHWTFFLKKMTSIPCEILKDVDMLRHVAVHRRHYELSIEDLENALKLPRLLDRQDSNKAIQRAYEVIKFPTVASAKQKEEIAQVIDVYNQPIITQNDLLSRIQYLLEISCFKYATQLDLPIHELGWTIPEEVELQQWEEYFQDMRVQQAQNSLSEHPAGEGGLSSFAVVLSSMRALRNRTVHRGHNVGESAVPNALEADVKLAMKFAIMIGDPDQAKEIEKLAQTWYAENSRPVIEVEFARPKDE